MLSTNKVKDCWYTNPLLVTSSYKNDEYFSKTFQSTIYSKKKFYQKNTIVLQLEKSYSNGIMLKKFRATFNTSPDGTSTEKKVLKDFNSIERSTYWNRSGLKLKRMIKNKGLDSK